MLARDNTSLIVAYFGRVYYGLSNGFSWASQAEVSNAIKFPLVGLSPQFYVRGDNILFVSLLCQCVLFLLLFPLGQPLLIVVEAA